MAGIGAPAFQYRYFQREREIPKKATRRRSGPAAGSVTVSIRPIRPAA